MLNSFLTATLNCKSPPNQCCCCRITICKSRKTPAPTKKNSKHGEMALVILWPTTSFYLICFSCRSDFIGALLTVSELHLNEIKIRRQRSSRTAVNYICSSVSSCGGLVTCRACLVNSGVPIMCPNSPSWCRTSQIIN